MEKLLNDSYKNVLEYNFKTIKENISNAAVKAGRNPNDITFLAATKTIPADIINYAISLGLTDIGENRVQEILSKHDELNLQDCNLHMIGHMQTNKVRKIVDKVNMIQSVDSLKLAKEISDYAKKNDLNIDTLIEVNIGKEENKSGVFVEHLYDLLEEISKLRSIKVKGLMAIPPKCENKVKIREYFSGINKIFVDIKEKKLDNISMDVLSMGMSNDYIDAILEGSTMIRVGSVLFGNRN